MRFFQNIRLRLTLWYLLVIAILMVFFGMVAYVLLYDSLSKETIDPYDMQIANLESGPNGAYQVAGVSDVASEVGPVQDQSIAAVGFTRDQLVKMADKDGNIQFSTSDRVPISINKSLLQTPGMTDASMIWFYLVNTSDANAPQLVIVSQSAYNLELTLGLFRQAIIVTAVVTLLLAGILGFFLVSRMLGPVQSITRTAREIQENNLGKRLTVRSRDEIGELASTLNQMLERLDAAFLREREFTADASHELRTPLAIAQGEATLALREERTQSQYREALEAVSLQISRTSSLINRLLFLARSDDRLELVMDEVDLRTLLAEVASDAQVLCEPEGIVLASDLSDKSEHSTTLKVKADSVRLRELFLNLVENAVRYTPEGGTITISLRREGNYAHASVGDTGIGIPQEHLPHIFKRFYRVDKSRSRAEGGVGLGLALCERIAQVHGGRIEVESVVGQGSTFSVFLPLVLGRSQ